MVRERCGISLVYLHQSDVDWENSSSNGLRHSILIRLGRIYSLGGKSEDRGRHHNRQAHGPTKPQPLPMSIWMRRACGVASASRRVCCDLSAPPPRNAHCAYIMCLLTYPPTYLEVLEYLSKYSSNA